MKEIRSGARGKGKGKTKASRETLAGVGPPQLVAPERKRLLRAGQLLDGAYRIGELLGEGGMGQVYEAHDIGLGRVVAVKVAWPDQGPDALIREARVMAGFHDPSLVGVLALGEDSGLRYVVMERLYGRTLHQHIQQRATFGSFAVDEVIHLLGGICAAVRALHDARLAHRDLKPGNLVVTAKRIVLLDFGILHSEHTTHAGDMPHGTPEYMAPEAIANKVEPGESYLTDLYALGVIGFELLTGRLPFAGESKLATVTAHLHDPVPDVASLRPDAPDELCRLIHDLLAKEPKDRPPSMEAVQARLKVLGWRIETLRSDPISVLIADDDTEMATLLHEHMNRLVPHCAIHVVHDGDDALRAFTQLPPDIMLLDLDMPGTNGIELAMYLRGTSLADHTHFAVVSARAGGAERELLDRLGVRDLITKGERLEDELRHVVGRILASLLHTRAARRRLEIKHPSGPHTLG